MKTDERVVITSSVAVGPTGRAVGEAAFENLAPLCCEIAER